MPKGFYKNVKATGGPCPGVDSFSCEERHNTTSCGVCHRTGTPLRFKGVQFPVLVIKEGNPKCLLSPLHPTQSQSPSPALLPWPLQGRHENQYRLCSLTCHYAVERALECLVRLFFYEGIAWVWTAAKKSTDASAWQLYQSNFTAHSIWKGSVGLSFRLLLRGTISSIKKYNIHRTGKCVCCKIRGIRQGGSSLPTHARVRIWVTKSFQGSLWDCRDTRGSWHSLISVCDSHCHQLSRYASIADTHLWISLGL